MDTDEIRYKLLRSSRKTVSIEINSDGELIVRAPKKLDLTSINNIINERSNWISEKINLVEKKIEKKIEIIESFENSVLMFGVRYPVEIIDNYKYALNFEEEKFKIDAFYFNNHRKHLIEQFLRKKARIHLQKRLKYFSELSGLQYRTMRITGAEKRWGSCSSKKTINFSWKLIMATPEVIDYVVFHELAHTKEMNHSRNFWALVQKYIPDYKAHLQWLKEHSYILEI